jgi:hypothetical protein
MPLQENEPWWNDVKKDFSAFKIFQRGTKKMTGTVLIHGKN